MVKKYIILADSSIGFELPKQLSVVCGEPIIKRTIRLLKENGITDITITSHDKRFDNLGAIRYEPKFNDYNPADPKSAWLKAFPIELMEEPTCYLFGDVYYSENAIKTIVEKDNNDILFFCTYENKSPLYIKHHDEPLAFKVHDFDKFKYHINRLIDMWNKDETLRRPITWELYRSINGQNVNVHTMTKNYIAINDESCDIDCVEDIKILNMKLGGIEMIKCEVIKDFTIAKYNELVNIEGRGANIKGKLFVGDTFECSKEMCDYLMGNNAKGEVVVKVVEIEPPVIEKVEPLEEVDLPETITAELKKPKKKKTSKKK